MQNNITIPNDYLQQFINSKVGDMLLAELIIHDEIKQVFVEIEGIKRKSGKVISVNLKEIAFNEVPSV